MELSLTSDESQEIFYNALCNGMGYIQGYGLEWNWNNEEYKIAKEKLKSPCFEDVLMQILQDGGTLNLIDVEGGDDEMTSIDIDHVNDRVQHAPLEHLMDMINENDDACTADVILQHVFFEEIVYG